VLQLNNVLYVNILADARSISRLVFAEIGQHVGRDQASSRVVMRAFARVPGLGSVAGEVELLGLFVGLAGVGNTKSRKICRAW